MSTRSLPADLMPRGDVDTFLAHPEAMTALLDHGTLLTSEEKNRIRERADWICRDRVFVHGYGEVNIASASCAAPRRLVDRMDYLVDLIVAHQCFGGRQYLEKAAGACNEWVARFRPLNLARAEKPVDTAIRLLNWIWLYQYAPEAVDWPGSQRLHSTNYRQVEFIKSRLSPGGNHLVLEALAIYCYGIIYSAGQCGNAWARLGKSILLREMERQVSADGVHSEQSMFYHQIVATHFLKFYLVALRSRKEIPPEFVNKLKLMLEYVHRTMKPDLTHPMLGDGDQMTSDDREHRETRALLPALYVLFDEKIYAGFKPSYNELMWWFLGEACGNIAHTKTAPGSHVFKSSGLAVLRHENHYLMFDAAPFGDNEFPHHGHADALGFEMVMNGETLFLDPGGYAYLNDTFRHYARGTFGHNTIVVGRRSQSEIHGVFGYGKRAKVNFSDYYLSCEYDFLEGVHDGYLPVWHKRQIYFNKSPQTYVVIIDLIYPNNEIDISKIEISFLLHLSPLCQLQSPNRITFQNKNANWSYGYYSNNILETDIISSPYNNSNVKGCVFRHDKRIEAAQVINCKTFGNVPCYYIFIIAPSDEDIQHSFDSQNNAFIVEGKAKDFYSISVDINLITSTRIRTHEN